MGDSAQRRLFGTDGIRGRANEHPMTPELALQLGRAVAHVFKGAHPRPRIVIGKDTRLSNYMFETALQAGVCSMGVDAVQLGVLPTPGIAFLTTGMRADAGIVISASHNPYFDNGIKFFAANGFKLPDRLELEIERLIEGGHLDEHRARGKDIGRAYRLDDAVGRYCVFLKSTFPRHLSLNGLALVTDCAHGAAYKVAPEVLYELGADVTTLGVSPDGVNINDGAGALHPEHMAALVRERGAHAGIALDGDADRVILCDEHGQILDGDTMLAILATHMQAQGVLSNDTVVATTMSNLGLERVLSSHSINLVRTDVGDRYVVERMRQGGFNLGGEQSGHLLMLDHTTTGDGLLIALQVLAISVETGRPLSELASLMERVPQVLQSFAVGAKPALSSLATVQQAISSGEARLADRGRVVVRYSGTEPKCRVMVEGDDDDEITSVAQDIHDAIIEAIGPPPKEGMGS
ncbi:MAG: phosphoglucosamine mutase [Myxococcota bacterium]|nr:phosphoglucosamine mutase [Myxococcota bacterium]